MIHSLSGRRPRTSDAVSLWLIGACVFLFAAWARADGQDTSALINSALDKQFTFQFDGVLPDVFKKIESQTDVPVTTAGGVYDLLPWGEQTNVGITVHNKTLREALNSICHRLGLTWDVGSQSVVVRPMPALSRLGRRATVDELNALALLDEKPMNLGADKCTVQQLVDAVDQKLADLKSPFAVEFRPSDEIKPEAPVNVPRNATMAQALECLTLDQRTDATWYPWGKSIVILPKEQVIVQQLQKTISKRFNNVDLGQALNDLSQAAGVDFDIEPGALTRVAPEFRRVSLMLDNASIRQALDNIRGMTGLDYQIKPTGVYLWNQNPNPTPIVANSPIYATLQLDNGMTLFLRENNLPPDIREYAEHKKQREYKRLREMMKDEGWKPTTQPTTKPANEDL